ncbi:RRP12-like protein [Protopterus annectens]|uniref:RRP12-like protein n=1 Tax=Protopterus annectens TaxID=7888 RepID=UPI001CFA27E0|nr:RRP12-like protein [Protopterus annectens]
MVKAGRLRSGSTGKLKRWKKGRSSECNPEIRRHREAARSRFFSRPAVNSDLTVDSLKLHNELQSGSLSSSLKELPKDSPFLEEEEDGVLTEKSGGTFLSGLSDCTNVTFGKVQRLWESNSAAHKEVCAVLAAVTDVIRSQGGQETETEYFAALMTTLEAVESPDSVAAVGYLLNLVLKRILSPLLLLKFSLITKSFFFFLPASLESGRESAVWIISCLATLLRKQDLTTWSYPSTLQIYHGLLSFTVHSKPKVRKAAQHGVCCVLRGSDFMFGDDPPLHHPAAQSTAKFCIQQIEESGGSKDATTTLHILGLLKDLLPSFPVIAVKSCCETMLRVMTLGHVFVTSCAMKAFHSLFSTKPSPSSLTAELNAQMITALYDYIPNENDLQPVLAWLTVMEKAHINLSRLQSDLCFGHLPRFFSAAMNCFLSPHTDVVSTAMQTLKTLIQDCVAPHVTEIGPLNLSVASGPASSICKLFRAVEDGLTYKFHASWAFVLQVLRSFFEVAGKQGYLIMKKCLQTLCDLRCAPQFHFTGELDRAVGAAVETMGPENVLLVIPLEITGTEQTLDFPRSWLIPVLRDHVKNAELGFFARYFMPLAASLKNRATELAEAGRPLESKIYDTLQWQIWTILPGFCNGPTDIVSSFKGVARTLGMLIADRADVRLTLCQALRVLISKGCKTDEDRAEVGRFAKNFLPILFNLYCHQNAEEENASYRAPVLDTIKSYLTLTEQKLVCGFLEKASEKLNNPESTEKTRLSVLDLISAMAPYTDEQALCSVYRVILPCLESKTRSIQKKAYRVLEEVCGGERESCKQFVHKTVEELKMTLLESLKSASSPAKRPRLKCLIHIVKQLSAEHEDFIRAIIPEVVLCQRSISLGLEASAWTLIEKTNHECLGFGRNRENSIQQYLALVYAGLVGSVTMISCTVLALTRLVYEFKDLMSTLVLEELLQNVCLLLGSKTREIVKSALGFVKVIVFIMDIKLLAQHLQLIMEGIGNIKDDIRRNLRVKLKNIYTKFIRKFGFDLVKSMLPEDCHKVLVNIRKTEAKNKKFKAMKSVAEAGSDSEDEHFKESGNSIEEILAETDSEEENKKPVKEPKKQVRKKSLAWLKEGEEDEPLNFLDPKVTHRVLATRPGVNKSSKTKHDFKITSDGRLIIKDNEEATSRGQKEELEDVMADIGIRSKKPQKKGLREEADEDAMMETDSQSQYKAGGSGIHRPLSKKVGFGEEYKSKKGRGDVKRKGKPDPYAYIPLNKAQLNRR